MKVTASSSVVNLEARRQRILSEPILPAILRLAAPNIALVVVQVASSTVDAFFVGRLGAEALAGVSLVFPGWMLMVTMSAGGMGGGISSAVARGLGAGRREHAQALVGHALLIAVLMGALFTAVFVLAGPSIYSALGGSGETLATAVVYSSAVFGGALAVWVLNSLASSMRGSGEMLVPAVVVVSGEVLHVGLSAGLIFGLGPLPSLGVAGAGLSLAITNVARAAALGMYVLSGRSGLRPRLVDFSPRWLVFADILRVGLPGSINTLLTNLNVIVVTGLVGTFGTFALAGYGMGARLEYLQIPLVFGLGSALVTLVGTSVGAADRARARRVAWVGAGLAGSLTGMLGLLGALFPFAWIGTFSSEPEVLAAGASYLRLVGPTYALLGLGLALYFASQGAGRMLWPLVAGVVRLLVVAGGGWMAVHWLDAGLVGIFVAIAVGLAVYGGSMALAINWTLRPVSRAR
jgi:putative MATE family efflux protein